MNKKTKDRSHTPILWQKFTERPIENTIGILGGGLAITSLLMTQVKYVAIAGHLWDLMVKLVTKVLFNSWASGLLTVGGIALAGVVIAKVIRKNKQMKAAEVYAAEQEANKGTARDVDYPDAHELNNTFVTSFTIRSHK